MTRKAVAHKARRSAGAGCYFVVLGSGGAGGAGEGGCLAHYVWCLLGGWRFLLVSYGGDDCIV